MSFMCLICMCIKQKVAFFLVKCDILIIFVYIYVNFPRYFAIRFMKWIKIRQNETRNGAYIMYNIVFISINVVLTNKRKLSIIYYIILELSEN